jgi:hypothetical protein
VEEVAEGDEAHVLIGSADLLEFVEETPFVNSATGLVVVEAPFGNSATGLVVDDAVPFEDLEVGA